jgi:uncharacterized protein (DUF3084 family)
LKIENETLKLDNRDLAYECDRLKNDLDNQTLIMNETENERNDSEKELHQLRIENKFLDHELSELKQRVIDAEQLMNYDLAKLA